ncbi:MAG TPA: iron export ABC transporter permease subunit FetB [Armatimonadota bacterium]|jgi:putative ABC transport system permease protein
MEHVIPVGYLDLLIAFPLVLGSLLLSWQFGLGLQRDMLLGALRTFVQLAVTGYVLLWIFARSGAGEWYWVLLALAVMLGVAVHTAQGRMTEALAGKAWVFAVAIVVGSLIVLAYVLALVLKISPWYNARYVLPLAGMIIGNAMTAGTLAVSRFAGDLRTRRLEVETALALGATAAQAVAPIRRDALRTAIIPSVNGMLVVGIVSLPGMMTGQILAGQDPTQAVHYQVVVMYMITAAAAFTSVIGVVAAIRQTFTAAQQLRLAEE